jgi:hypothetical protein
MELYIYIYKFINSGGHSFQSLYPPEGQDARECMQQSPNRSIDPVEREEGEGRGIISINMCKTSQRENTCHNKNTM